MNDTSEKFASMIAERHRQMTPEMRMQIASQMFDTARAIVEASLPVNLSRYGRRLALIERIHGNNLQQAAKIAFAAHDITHADEAPIQIDVAETLADSDADRVVDNAEVRRRFGLKG